MERWSSWELLIPLVSLKSRQQWQILNERNGTVLGVYNDQESLITYMKAKIYLYVCFRKYDASSEGYGCKNTFDMWI